MCDECSSEDVYVRTRYEGLCEDCYTERCEQYAEAAEAMREKHEG